MAERIKLVRGDTRPQIKTVILDDSSEAAMNIAGSVVVMRFREVGAVTLQATVPGVLLTGLELPDGTLNTAVPYNIAGSGGRVVFLWAPTDLDCEPGDYEGEIEITFQDGAIQTVYTPLRFRIREDF